MIEINDLMEAVKGELGTLFPGEKVYVDKLPKEFKRPSAALECQSSESVDANRYLVRRNVTLLLILYVEQDAYYDSSREELNRRMDMVCARFACGTLRVKDRHIPIRTDRGTGAPDLAAVTLGFQWVDERPGIHDPEDMEDPESASIPKMQQAEVRVGTGGDQVMKIER